MIQGKQLIKPYSSKQAQETISRLDNMLQHFIGQKASITSNMAKGYLDYYGISKEAWKWRYEKMYNANGDVSSDIERELDNMTSNPRVKPQSDCNEMTPEEYFGFAWQTIRIVQDKTDEFLDDINNRKFSVGVSSVPYKNLESIFQYQIKNKMDKPETKLQIANAIFMAAIKGTGFLRPVLYDITSTSHIPTFDKEGITTRDKWKKVETKERAGVIIESIDPERVYVDTAAEKPKDLFIITPLDPSELAYRFPDLKNRITEYSDKPLVAVNGEVCKEGCLSKTYKFDYHTGEQIREMYEAGSFWQDRFNNYFGNHAGISNRLNNTPAFEFGNGGKFWNGMLYSNMSERRQAGGYFLIEYYDLANDVYTAYIDDTVVDKGSIPATFKGLPIVPIKLENKDNRFFGTPLNEYFGIFQDQQTAINMKQRVNEIVQGTSFVAIDGDQIDETRHPNKQLSISQYAPLQEVHIKDTMAENMARPPAIQPISFNNGSDNALQTRLAFLQGTLEKQFPSLKSLIASNQKEFQTQMIYSRDAKTNTFLRNVTLSLSKFSSVLLQYIMFEMRYFNNEYADNAIPLYKGSKEKATLFIVTDEEDLISSQNKFRKELTTLYLKDVNSYVEQMFQNPDLVNPIMEQIKAEIENQVVQTTLQSAGIEPESNEDFQMKREAILTDQSKVDIILEETAKQGPKIVRARLSVIARQQIPERQDTRIYISFEDLNNYQILIEDVKFELDKTQAERQAEMVSILNTIQPIVQFTPFVIKFDEYIKQTLLANNQNPDDWLQPNQPKPSKMVETLNSRTNYFFDLLKNPVIAAQYLNENLGKEIFTPDMLVQGLAMEAKAMSDIKIEEITARGNTKVAGDVNKYTLTKETDFLVEQAKANMQKPQDIQS